jgi:hypothetical protein
MQKGSLSDLHSSSSKPCGKGCDVVDVGLVEAFPDNGSRTHRLYMISTTSGRPLSLV